MTTSLEASVRGSADARRFGSERVMVYSVSPLGRLSFWHASGTACAVRGADKAITNAIDKHILGPDDEHGDGRAGVLVPVA